MEDIMPKTVVITGASRGIGKSVAISFAGKDTNIVINCVHQAEKLEEVKEEIIRRGSRCEAYVGDISDYSVAENMFAMVRTVFGQTDILINNAGISMIGLFQDLTRSDWDKIINTNLGSVYNCCHFAISDMVHQHSGKIINISSVWGIAGASCEVAYSASKGAINALTKALAKELAPSSIQVNAVACGAIHTDMNAFLNKEEMEALIEEIPSGRLGSPDEVASFVYELATGNDYLTGQVIQLDGGWI
jgi:3-oxoacyl-[acyl-carrier protein] reductase